MSDSFTCFARTAKAVGVAALVAGCTYQGGVENPIVRKATWFSYLAGDDIKRECVPGRLAQYRLVYNAVWGEQVRAYDLRRSATGAGAVLFIHVFGGANVAEFTLPDFTGPWRGTSADRRLDESRYVELIRAIEASDFGGPPPEGDTLASWNFYWVVSACADGRFHWNAWRAGSERFADVRFDRLLFAHDSSGVPINAVRPVSDAEARLKANSRDDPYDHFELKVGREGLVGRLTLF